MDCEQTRENLLDYREGELKLDKQVKVGAHLQLCAECSKELQRLNIILSAVAALPAPDPWPGFARRLRARINEQRRPGRARWARSLKFGIELVGACFALVLAAGALWSLLQRVESSAVTGGSRLEAPSGGDDGRSVFQEDQKDTSEILSYWGARDWDWMELSGRPERRLALLAISSIEMTAEEAVAWWNPEPLGRKEVEGLAEITGFTDAVAEGFLDRIRR